MKVRTAHLLDLGRVEAIHRESGTLLSAQPPSVRLWSLVSHTLSALLPLSQETLLYVAEERGKIVGFVQASSSGSTVDLSAGTKSLQVLNLCVAEGHNPDEVIPELVEHLANRALQRGVVRLLVRAPLDDPVTPIIRLQGFRQYATENVLFAESPEYRHVVPAGLRAGKSKDSRMLYHLYRKVTPQGVSQVEAPTYKDWKTLRDEPGGQQFVVDRVELVAWSRVQHSSEPTRPHTLGFMVLPELGLADDVADHALSQAGGGPAWSSLRHYDSHMIDALRGRGFTNLLTQALLVKELALREPVREKGLVPSYG
ncbi:MAG TPA: hypothetical protein VF134_04740 [Candidatus Dormibacteraeota bacterium]